MVNEKTMKYLINILIVIVLSTVSANTQQLTVVTTVDYGQYNYLEGGKVKGAVTEIARAILAKAGIESEVHAYPRPQAYKIALEGKNVLFFTVARTIERERLFQ